MEARTLSDCVPKTDSCRDDRSVHADRTKKQKKPSVDQIILDLNRKQQRDGIQCNIPKSALCDQRRLVFVSLVGLYWSWQDCPSSLLYSAVLVVPHPFKREWCLHASPPTKSLLLDYGNLFQDWDRWQTFRDLLQWKDAQGLVFWAAGAKQQKKPQGHVCDDANDEKSPPSQLVSAFWKDVNSKIVTLYDPVAQSHYQPLQLDADWWQNIYGQQVTPHFGCKVHQILAELYFTTMRFRCIQEILHQSNPHSFRLLCNVHELESNFPNEQTVSIPSENASGRPEDENTQPVLESNIVSVSLSRSIDIDHSGFYRVCHIDGDLEPESCCHDDLQLDDVWMVSAEYMYGSGSANDQ